MKPDNTPAKATATYTRLKNGKWGLRVVGNCSSGMKIEVKRKDGDVSEQTIGKLVLRFKDYSIYEISSLKVVDKNSSGGFVTHPKKPLPKDWDNGEIPFDGPYVRRK
jgi:hypothetical protein